MQFKHDCVFVPEGVASEDIEDTKWFEFKTSDYIMNRPEKTVEEAISTGFIDEYALRNYWELAIGETRVVNHTWDSKNHLTAQLEGINQVKSVSVTNDKTSESLMLDVENQSMLTVKNKIESIYSSKMPIFQGYGRYEIFLSVKWIGSNRFFFDDLDAIWSESG